MRDALQRAIQPPTERYTADVKVAYLINQYPKISHSFIRREIIELERQGIEVFRVAVRGWDGDLNEPADQAERDRTTYILQAGFMALAWAVLRQTLLTPLKMLRAVRTAIQLSKGSNRSLFFHLAYVAEASWLLSRLNAAQVKHVHAHFGTNPAEIALQTHLLGGPGYSVTMHGPEEFDRPEGLHLQQKIHHARFVIAISHYSSGQLRRWSFHEDWHKIHVVRCGIERTFYTGHDSPPNPGARIVCVGRLCEQKGHLLLMEAVARLKQEGVCFNLILAGDGELRSLIESSILELGISDYVTITGYIDATRVREEIIKARALVLPSFAEGLPVVIMEAMLLQRPVISTYVGGIPELVVDQETGWLVPAGDIDGLVSAIRGIFRAKPEQLAAMGNAGRGRALAMHTIELEAGKLAALLMSTCAEKSAPA